MYKYIMMILENIFLFIHKINALFKRKIMKKKLLIVKMNKNFYIICWSYNVVSFLHVYYISKFTSQLLGVFVEKLFFC